MTTGHAMVEQAVEERDRGGALGQRAAPGLEGPLRGDPERAPLVGDDHEAKEELGPVSSSGARSRSSTMARPARSTLSISRPTELSARRRYSVSARVAAANQPTRNPASAVQWPSATAG